MTTSPPSSLVGSYPRKFVREEIRSILRTGRQRIIELGGDCDPVDRMLHDSMHMLDQRAKQSDPSS